MDPFIGEIRIFGFNYAPENWAFCDGHQLPMQQYQALFSLILTLYGGSGNPPTAFAVPNLQSQVPMGATPMVEKGSGFLNKSSGAETVLLNQAQLPVHTHTMGGETIGFPASQTNVPGPTVLPNLVIVNSKATASFSNATPTTYFHPSSISPVGGNGVHENRQPFMALNFCICLDGIYPDFP